MDTEKKIKEPGFFKGFLHGAISPFKLIGKIFNPSIKIFDTEGKSKMYKFGVLLGILGALGNASHSSKSKKKKEEKVTKDRAT
jgi:hypothetical protein